MTKYAVQVNGKNIEATLLQRSGPLVTFSVNDKHYEVEVNPILLERASAGAQPVVVHPASTTNSKTVQVDAVSAPMPGIIVQVLVKAGDSVLPGQTVVVMEAMKMENNVASTRAGKVTEVLVKTGDEVSNNQVLIKFE